ncbi:MAG: LAGLIDADG family homing endonuclease [Nanoarchaeota archaeon]|nr:LAGLIDADG family homing endonuclease [Nanoarchaeota archaeon]
MLSDDYVTGLVDGEGSFNVRVNHIGRRAKVELKFSLKLRHQDKEILDELKTFFGCGNVYIQRDKRANHSLCYRFEVQNRKEILEKVLPFFEKNSPKLPSRKNDFELFKEIVSLTMQKPLNLSKIQNLKQQMHWGLAAYGKTVCAVGTQSNFKK